MRCGGNWKRDYGDSYTGTKGETPDTAKELPTDYRASSRPYQQPVMPFTVNDNINLIVRLIAPLVSQPPLVDGGPAASGISDMSTLQNRWMDDGFIQRFKPVSGATPATGR